MFYLKNFFSLLFKYPFRGAIFLLGHFLLFLCCYYGPELEKNFWHNYGDLTAYPYFYVLYSGESNPDFIRSKIVQVPGVREVELVDEKRMKVKVQESLRGVDIPTEYLPHDLKAIKVSVVSPLSTNAFHLMEDYLKRLSGDSELTLTPIRENRDPKLLRQKEMVLFLKEWGDRIVLVFVFVFWGVGLFLFRGPIREVAELLENYQRRKKIELKLILMGLPFYNLTLIWSLINFTLPYIPGLVFINIFYILIVLLTTQKRYA